MDTDLIIVRRQLLKQLSDTVSFTSAIHVRNFVLRDLREVEMDLRNEQNVKLEYL